MGGAERRSSNGEDNNGYEEAMVAWFARRKRRYAVVKM